MLCEGWMSFFNRDCGAGRFYHATCPTGRGGARKTAEVAVRPARSTGFRRTTAKLISVLLVVARRSFPGMAISQFARLRHTGPPVVGVLYEDLGKRHDVANK